MGHNFEQSGPGDMIHEVGHPEGHAHLDQKYQKGMRSPMLGRLPVSHDTGLTNPEVAPGLPSEQNDGHGSF